MVATLTRRNWVPGACEDRVQDIAAHTAGASRGDVSARIDTLVARNREIHERECFNLNPATNVMNPRAEAILSQGLGSRPSLGYPGDKYEMGLEAIEEIEVIAAELAAEVFGARFAEVRVGSGALSNLYCFLATCRPGDTIIAPSASIGGHVTHHAAGCAGLLGLTILDAPVDPQSYSVDVDALRKLALETRPRLITIGGSLNLFPHPVREIKSIADEVGARLLFDAAHQCGIIAGGAWPDPLQEGADLMTMSTYKSLAGPAGGLIVTNDAELAERIDAIAFPGLTANFDVAKSAALALTMLDWLDHGRAYAAAMVEVAKVFADECIQRGLPVFGREKGATQSHQFAIEAAEFGGGQAASKTLRRAGFLACGIGLPVEPVEGDLNGLRIGTPELVRWGVGADHIPQIADLVADALRAPDPEALAAQVRELREGFDTIHFVRDTG